AVAQQDVIDAQAEIALEGVHPIVPPAERPVRLLEQTKAVLETDVEQAAERGTLGFAEQDSALPQPRIVHIAFFGSDIAVAQQGELRMVLQLLLKPAAQGGEPG